MRARISADLLAETNEGDSTMAATRSKRCASATLEPPNLCTTHAKESVALMGTSANTRACWISRQKNFCTLLIAPGSRKLTPGTLAERCSRPVQCLSHRSEAGLQIRWTTRRSVAVLTLLALLACALCISTYRIFGNFWDEPEHIAAGLVLIDRGEYLYDNQHPPLARLAAAIGPYLAGARFRGDSNPNGEAQGRDLLYHSTASYEQLLTLARLGMLPFLLVLLGATWSWMRHWHGDAAALLAVLFLVSSPVILGHAAVVALDVPVTALSVASLYLLRLGMLRASPLRRPIRSQLLRRAGSGALALALALLLVIGVYGGKLVYLTTPDMAPSKALNFIAGSRGLLHDLAYRFAARVPLPLGFQMVPLNFLGVEWHNENGHRSFLLGQIANRGWWYFYIVALTFKTTVPLLLLGLPGLALLAIRAVRESNLYLLAPSACFVSILIFCCGYSHINLGVRHVLIAYPLLAMGAGYATVAAWNRWRWRAARAALIGLTLWQA